MARLKIISYNIREGFYTRTIAGDSFVFKHEPERQQAAQEMIKKEQPDVLILAEANFIRKDGPSKIKQDYKKIFNFPFESKTFDIFFDGTDWGVSILSKFPMVNSGDYTVKQFRFARAVIKIKQKQVTIDGIHPAPNLSDFQKGQMMKSMLRDIKNPYILAGDFNSLSHKDGYEKSKLIKAFRRIFKEKTENNINEWFNFSALREIEKHDLIDTFRAKNKKFDYSIPSDLMSKNKETGIRIDYIFCSKDCKIIDAGIIKNNLTEKASDHYPVFAVLEI